MKQHHLSLKGVEQSIVIEARKRMAEITQHIPHVPEASKPLIIALFDILTVLAGDALEMQMMTEEEIRALINDARTVISRRKVRPKISQLQSQLLRALGRTREPTTLAELSTHLYVSRGSINTALYACLSRGLIRREIRGKVAWYTLTDKAAQFRAENEVQVSPGALIQNPHVAPSRRAKVVHGPRMKDSW